MLFIGVEVEQEKSAPPPKKNPGSAPATNAVQVTFVTLPVVEFPINKIIRIYNLIWHSLACSTNDTGFFFIIFVVVSVVDYV